MLRVLHLSHSVESAELRQPSLPALELLTHDITYLPVDPAALLRAPDVDLILLDATVDLLAARSVSGLLRTVGTSAPLILVLTEGGLTAVRSDWGASDVILTTAGPAEIEARFRLAAGARPDGPETTRDEIRSGQLLISEASYTAKVGSRTLDLTYKEFELLKYLALNPGHVFTRAQLLQEVWGYDYYGGTRTVDVHVRRLRAKLGAELEQSIGTVRNVGYRFTPLRDRDELGHIAKDSVSIDDASGTVDADDPADLGDTDSVRG
ncbi:response regulator transcription factor [Saxibacter everestensis]|uniref:Response regulator transcription factor n=1 Tax=Saxibacter everestensis TaxID=2909229 RepID=A0ABY8QVW0_9MICO|nr:response regulator transcription factor [Brevibacteriaceae bacterium ZFBP1038]